ncbi:unnamed protein product [Chondrus crispus]|uniref:Uncharacterized protein n=1 Tax=Chondrus crispus TaxID=2769 RepID=R7QQ17_CHOCR|nr:unnamed protein product [Chondrus crispus]CDF39561.1 unnamed protein product [Chondrus crispus]|eukprot:XP_005709855.1 unnamed protein product [Chondrus crispus]
MDLGSDGREAFGFDEVPDSRYRSRHTGRQVVQRQGTDARSQAHNRSENIRMGAQHSSRFSGEKRKAGVTGELPLELRRALIWEGDADPIQPAHVASTAPCRSRERRELHSSAQGSMDKQQEDESLQDIARLSDADCLPSPSRCYAQSGPNAYLVAGQARPKPVAVGPAHGNERRHRSPDQRRTQARQSAVIATGHGATVQTDALQREGGDDEQCDSRNEELSRLDRDEGAIRKTQTYADAVKMAKEAAASAAKAVLDSFLSAGMIDKSTGANRNRVQQNCDRIGHSVAEAGGFVAARITEETPAVGSSQRNIASKQYSMPLTCRNPRDLSKRALDGTQSPLTKRCRYPPASASKSSKQISSLPPEGEGVNPESLEKDLLGKKRESERRYAECTVQQLWQQLERSRVSQKAVRESLKNIRTLVHIFLHQVVGVLRKDDYDEPVENYLRDYLKVMGKLPMQLHK